MSLKNYEKKLGLALLLAKTFASSGGLPGGIEAPWYACYNTVLQNLFCDSESMQVAPQFPLAHEFVDDDDNMMKEHKIPDFAIVRLIAGSDAKTLNEARVIAVVEIKPYDAKSFTMQQTRWLRDVVYDGDPDNIFSKAYTQAREQAKFVFSEYNQNTVIAIHAIGSHWSYNIYKREPMSPPKGKNKGAMEYEEPKTDKQITEYYETRMRSVAGHSGRYELGSEASDTTPKILKATIIPGLFDSHLNTP